VAVQLVSKISDLCGPDPPTLQTDGQTDDMRSQYRAMHYSASRGKKHYCVISVLTLFISIASSRSPIRHIHQTYSTSSVPMLTTSRDGDEWCIYFWRSLTPPSCCSCAQHNLHLYEISWCHQ